MVFYYPRELSKDTKITKLLFSFNIIYLIKYRKELHITMKDKLTLRNLLIWVAGLFGILVFVFSFITAYRLSHGSDWTQINGIIWGARTTTMSDGSSHTAAPEDATKALGLPLVGAILVFLGAVCAVVVSLFGEKFLKDEKIRKIVLFVAGGFMVLGGVFTFFTMGAFEELQAKEGNVTVQQYRDALAALGMKASCGLPIVSGILAILGGGAVVASQFVPDKKLGK